jgi:hypothetical protein
MLKISSKVCCHFGRTSQRDIVGRVTAHYIALLILYTCFCAYKAILYVQARSTTNGKIRRQIQIPQMFETDPALSPFPQKSTLYHHSSRLFCSGSRKDGKV